MYILASNIWFTKLMKQFFFWIDKIVFNFISIIYDVMISIARTSVFTQSDISQMADRIYKLLAIFMVFKVTLSLITYVVNPDDFSDKSKGVSKLGINIVISMALLILTPYIFSYAYQFQTIVLEDNSLGVLIFGGDESNESFFNTAGDKIAYTTMTPFFTPNTSIEELIKCTTLVKDDGKFNSECSEGLTSLENDNFTEQTRKNYIAGVENGVLGLMFRQEMAVATYETEDDETEFIMDYKFIFSTVTGVIIILLLITFCMDIAVRSIKLAFLQLIAPIPIISYVDPKSGKDGLFKKWYEMCIKTFLSLFIRLIALYFAVFIISKVADLKLVDVVDGSYVRNGIISIFIIIGALMFAKQLPKMLEGLGIKLDSGSFTLNPLRKMEKEALGGKILKKPNDGLANLAKGGFGAKTFARKMSSGIDAARQGKGFTNGWSRYKGGVGKWLDKQRESYTPYSLEAAKKKKEAKENIKLKDNMSAKGERLYNQHGKNISEAFSNSKYRESYDGVNNLKKEMYNWEQEVEKRKAALNASEIALANNPDDKKIKQKVELDRKALEKAMEQSGKSKAQYDLAKAKHDDLKNIYTKDAELENSHDFYMKTNGLSAEVYGSSSLNGESSSNSSSVGSSSSSSSGGSDSSSSSGGSDSSSSSGGSDSSSSSGGSSSSSSSGGSDSSSSSGGSSSSSSSGGNDSNSSNGGSSSSSSSGGSSSSSSSGGSNQPSPEAIANEDRERIKNEIDAQVEELEKKIENIKDVIDERRSVYKPRIDSLEKLVDQYKEQRRNVDDVTARDAIDKELDQAIAKLDSAKAELKRIEETYGKQIEDIKKMIETLKNGV